MTDLSQTQLSQNVKDVIRKSDDSAKSAVQVFDADVIRAEVNNIVYSAHAITGMFETIRSLSYFFSIQNLTDEGRTDVSKIDLNYMHALGTQLIKDSRELSAIAVPLLNRVNKFKADVDSALNANDSIRLLNIGNDSSELCVSLEEFTTRFSTVCMSALSDIISHVNAARAPENQIKLN